MKSVFVSSTFRDMQAERDALAHKVIPELNVYAREFGENIRFVDLRWGVNTAELESDEGSKKVLKVCLDEIDNTRPYMIILIGERYGWIPPAEMIKTAADNKNHPLYDYEKSVTELEIEYGALAEKGQLEQCLFYFREPLKKEEIPSEAQGAYIEADTLLEAKLSVLKEKIKASGASVKSYACEWDAENSTLTVPESFSEMVKQDVQGLFERDFEKLRGLSWQEREEISARLFAEQKAAQFAGRYPVLESIKATVCDEANSLYILSGDAGSGKSTMMAKLLSELQAQNETFFFSCGNSRASQTGFDMLKQIVYKFESLLGIDEHFGERKENEQNTPEEWAKKFSEYAYLYAQKDAQPFYILCDALDQLTKGELVEKFSWLPSSLPKGVTVVVSCLATFKLPTFYPLQNQSKTEHLSALSNEEIPQIIESIVSFHGKELSDVVAEAIATLSGCDNPLYISMALQRLLMLDSDDFAEIAAGGNDMNAINTFMLNLIASFPESAEDMAVLVLSEAAERVDTRICNDLSAFLATSRRGLRETDIEGVFTLRGERYSRVEISLFTNYLSNFFLRRDDGRLDFTHRVIREGLLKKINFNEFNTAILEHLKSLDTEDNVRLSEIVWHAYKADDKGFLSEYIEYIEENVPIAVMMAASELHDITLQDIEWVQELAQYAVLKKECENFANFINFDFYNTFTISVEEYKILSKVMETCIEILKERIDSKPYNENERDLANSFIKMGDIYKTIGKYNDAMPMCEESLAIRESWAKKLKTPDSYSNLSTNYNKVGDIYQIQGKHEEALEKYEKAFIISEFLAEELNTPDSHRNLSISYNNLGDIYQIQGKHEEALAMFEKSLRITERLSEELNTPDSHRNLSISYNNLGDIYQIQGVHEEALAMFEISLQVSERLAKELNTPLSYADLSVSYEKVGFIYYSLGRNEDALVMHENSLKIREKLAEELNTPNSHQNLSFCCDKVGDDYRALGKYQEALAMYEKAFVINERLAQELDTPKSYRDLSISYDNVGDIYKIRDKHEKAVEMYEKALSIRLRLIEELKTPDSYRDLSISYNRVDNIYQTLGRSEDTLRMYEKSLVTREYLAEELNTPNGYRKLSACYDKMGEIYKALDRHEDALVVYIKSIQIYERLAEKLKTSDSYFDLFVSVFNVAYLYDSIFCDDENTLKCLKKCVVLAEFIVDEWKFSESYENLIITYTAIANLYGNLSQHEKQQEYEEKAAIAQDALKNIED